MQYYKITQKFFNNLFSSIHNFTSSHQLRLLIVTFGSILLSPSNDIPPIFSSCVSSLIIPTIFKSIVKLPKVLETEKKELDDDENDEESFSFQDFNSDEYYSTYSKPDHFYEQDPHSFCTPDSDEDDDDDFSDFDPDSLDLYGEIKYDSILLNLNTSDFIKKLISSSPLMKNLFEKSASFLSQEIKDFYTSMYA